VRKEKHTEFECSVVLRATAIAIKLQHPRLRFKTVLTWSVDDPKLFLYSSSTVGQK
jgi:hypothetical protein